jgi:glycosyltransferase involved in cell wall biosynthesis
MNLIAQNLKLKHLQFCFQPYAFFWDTELINSLPFSKKILLKFYKKLFGKLDISATKSSDSILTINDGSKTAIERVYGKKSIPTNMGIDIQKNKSDKNLLNLGNHKKIIHTTDWSPLKNSLWLIEQFSILQNHFSNVTLMITETNIDSSEKNKALKLIKEKNLKNIIFLGTLSLDDYSKYLRSSDIVIYSGTGSGITTSLFVLECMALGIPSLVSEQGSEDVSNGNTGFVYATDAEFQNYLIKLLDNDELRSELGTNAKTYVIKKHSWMNVGKIFQKEIMELIKK